ncbi:hypothetical protein ACFL3R_01330 [Thermodesulfobacteriota bacterium]
MKAFQSKLLIMVFIILSACGGPKLTQEELKQIESLKSELEKNQKEIALSEEKNSELAGGLLKALIEARLEILKTNKALIDQRIHAMESGVKVIIETKGSKPNIEKAIEVEKEIKAQENELKAMKKEAEKYSGGLIAAMKIATVATQEQTLAMLRQKYLILKYGLDMPDISTRYKEVKASEAAKSIKTKPEPAPMSSEEKVAREIITVRLLKKEYTDQDYQEFIFFDIEFKAPGLDKPARAIKGILNFEDLFGETKFRLNMTINDPMSPNGKLISKGSGFKFNQFRGPHQWIRSNALKDMKASFTVKSILYQDGTNREL